MSINNRFKSLIDHVVTKQGAKGIKGGNRKKLAEQLDIPYSTLQNYYHGKRANIEIDALRKLYIHLSININWLLTGEGDMFLNEEQKPQDDVLAQLTIEQRQEILARTQEMRLLNNMKQRLEDVEKRLDDK